MKLVIQIPCLNEEATLPLVLEKINRLRAGAFAVIGALAMMLLYIWFRFEWQFSVGAVLALTHDVILTIGMFSITQIEFNLSIIAAILTIIGYSLNDTIIVFDRIRENRGKLAVASPSIMNRPCMVSYLSRYARLSAGTRSLTATISKRCSV